MATELPRPGVEVIQQFRTVSPTIVTPTLVPCVVGPAWQVIEALESDGTINTDALVSTPAIVTATNAEDYAGLDGLTLIIKHNNGADQTFTFADPSATNLTAQQLVDQINASTPVPSGFSPYTITVGANTYLQLRTTSTGTSQTLQVGAGTANTVLGLLQFEAAGASNYIQDDVFIPQSQFPDPRSNIDELNIDETSIRAFLNLGTSLKELKDDETLLRRGRDAQATTDIDASTGLNVTGLTLIVTIDGVTYTTTFSGGDPVSQANMVTQINAVTGTAATATASGNFINITSNQGNMVWGNGTANAVLDTGANIANGLEDYNVIAIDDGDSDTLSPILRFPNENFTAAAAAAGETPNTVITSENAAGGLNLTGLTLVMALDGGHPQTITFSGGDPVSQANIVTQINDVMGAGVAAASGNFIAFLSQIDGLESKLEFFGGTAVAILDTAGTIDDGSVYYGLPFPPQVGDEVWVEGVKVGAVTVVTPGAVVTDLRLDAEVTFATYEKKYHYIVSKGIASADVQVTRPTPDLVVDLAGSVSLKNDAIFDARGEPFETSASIILAYKALRLDLSAAASSPALITVESTDELETLADPITTDNPWGLGMFYALVNAPGVKVSGLGIDATSADAPEGTLAAYTSAAEYLEAKEVYAIAPLTHDQTVHQMFQTHVNSMSGPTQKGERVVLINPSEPSEELPELVASGTDGDYTATNTFDTKISSLAADLLAAGIANPASITVAEGVYLDIKTDAKRYNLSGVSGTVATIRVTFSSGENDDDFYSETNLPTTLISEDFSVLIRGAAITSTTDIAAAYQGLGKSYGDRRVVMVAPDSCAANIDGLEQIIDGYYMCAAISGMTGEQPPQQGFTNFPMAGFTRVIGSNDKFSTSNLNVGAAGGVYWVVQDTPGGALTSRHQLTTDLTSIETREYSITKVVDFVAKFMRSGLRAFIGRFNITQPFLDSLTTVIQGQLGFLAETGVIIGGDLNNLVQDTTAPDTVLVDVTLDVPYPCNFIRLTLVI